MRVRSFLSAIAILTTVGVAGVPAGGAESEIRIIRDKFGVPHVYAATDEDASYGVGYALAQDRLWQMHVFRLIGKGRLSHLLGPLVQDIDRDVRFFTYTEEERAARFKTYPKDIRRSLKAFVEGINAWISEVQSDPSRRPYEFQKYAEPIDEWTVDDSLALQDVLILAFGSGGGNELFHAVLLSELREKLGKEKGTDAFNDLVVTVDNDGPITVPENHRYQGRPNGARVAEADRRRAFNKDARLSLEEEEDGAGDASSPVAATGLEEQLSLFPDLDLAKKAHRKLERGRKMFERVFQFGSNAQIAAPQLSKHGNALGTAGPQVGYLLPQWLADFGIHGDTFDATGMTFPGAGPAVLIGRGNGYAWTSTTGASDMTDTYIEELNPEDDHQYKYKGKWQQMDCRDETYEFKGVPFDSEEICRTIHGPVFAIDTENNVAASLRYAWFNREGQTVEGFFRYQSARNLEDFATDANFLASNHNMFYVDDQGNYGFWTPGNHPIRKEGLDIRLPQHGTGGSEWKGLMPILDVPHAVNFERGWLSNWNNQPAVDWERERAYAAVDNANSISMALNPSVRGLNDPFGGRLNPDGKLDFDDMSANLRYAAFMYHNHPYFRPFVPAPESLEGEMHQAAAALVRSWDGVGYDSDEDELYDSAAYTIEDLWIDKMHEAVFADDLGEEHIGEASTSLLWRVLRGDRRSSLDIHYDWLGDSSARKMAEEAFVAAVDELAEDFESENPEEWRSEISYEHYQRLNAEILEDTAEQEVGITNYHADSGRPGDVADHIEMDRGTYGAIYAYLDPPAGADRLGLSRSKTGSVIPPGQSGHISVFGAEPDHYEDQWDLYAQWKYKPMPMTLKEAQSLAESEETITREEEGD
jgi:penicillin amidase